MSETVVILSSGDESEHEKDDKEECSNDDPVDIVNEELSGETSKKRKIKPTYVGRPEQQVKKRRESNGSVSPTEDHQAIFDEFIDICLKLDDKKSQMDKIIDTKLKKYYSLLVPEYRNSEQFITLLQRKGAEMERSPSQMFVHIKEVVDELYVHRSDKIDQPTVNVSDRTIRKLCKAMELIHRKIKKIEEREVDWDEEGDSSYIQLQRYRERLVKIDTKLRELEGNAAHGFHRKISFSGTQFPKINKAIEKYVNVKGEFPDYYDIYHNLKTEYENENIDISASKLKCEAKAIFQNIGEQLQNLRKAEIWEAHRSFLSEEVPADPADKDEALKNVLDENKKKFQANIDEIINSFAERPTSKAQFESEDSNSSGGVVKKEKSKAKDEEDDHDEDEEKKDNSDAGGKEEVREGKDDGSNGDDNEEEEEEEEEEDDEEDEEEEEEEERNKKETVDDILNDIGEEEQQESMDETESVFMNCAPVSPPVLHEEDEVVSLSPHHTDSEGDGKEHGKTKEEEMASVISVLQKQTELDSVPGCSKWDNKGKEEKQSSSNNGENHEKESRKTVIETPTPQTFIKVKSLTSLQSKEYSNVPEEILLE